MASMVLCANEALAVGRRFFLGRSEPATYAGCTGSLGVQVGPQKSTHEVLALVEAGARELASVSFLAARLLCCVCVHTSLPPSD